MTRTARSNPLALTPAAATSAAAATSLPVPEPARDLVRPPAHAAEHPPRIERLPLAALTPWAKNARTHSRKQVRQIADSITTFGFTNPVLVDAGGTILAGHGRVEAARLLGWETVPCVCLEHMTPAQKRAYVLADNSSR